MDDDAIHDLFLGLGPITIRRMFGGKGIYFNGAIIALEVDDEIFLKADNVSAADFAAAGCRQWTYIRRSKAIDMPYWSIPHEALDDPDVMAIWARRAYEASLRSSK